jgi:hypothetical protein
MKTRELKIKKKAFCISLFLNSLEKEKLMRRISKRIVIGSF